MSMLDRWLTVVFAISLATATVAAIQTLAEITPTWYQPGDNMIAVTKNGIRQMTPNTASIATRTIDVSNVDHWCKDSSGSQAYLCATPSPAAWGNGGARGYQPGSWVMLQPSVSSLGPASLTVNNQGLANIKLSDGTTDPGNLLQAGRIYLLVQDGVVWRMSQGDSHQ